MSQVKFAGASTKIAGELPKKGTKLPDFVLTKNNLQDVDLDSFKGKKLILNIFPSLDTSVCATTVRKFNTMANEIPNTLVLCISKDLPFAMERFCVAENLENVITLSAFRTPDFGKTFGVEIMEGPLRSLFARAIIVTNENEDIIYEELVSDITNEPDYNKVLEILTT